MKIGGKEGSRRGGRGREVRKLESWRKGLGFVFSKFIYKYVYRFT